MVAAALREREEEGEEPYIRIFGAGHPDPKQRKLRREAGTEKPYHIRIGYGPDAVWIAYKDFAGVGTPLALAGGVSDKVLNGDYDPEQGMGILTDAMMSGVAMTLNREMMGGLANLLSTVQLYAKGDTAQGKAKLRELGRGMIGPYLNPGMMKVVEDLVSGTRFDSYNDLRGTLLAAFPMGQTIAGEPQINVLAEEIKVSPMDVLAGRFVSSTSYHPILGPLTGADLIVPPPSRMVVADESLRSGVRPPTTEETRLYNQAYGEFLRDRLSQEGVVGRLVEQAKTNPNQRQRAQDRLSSLGTAAAKHAWRVVRDEMQLQKGNARKSTLRKRAWSWQEDDGE
jgi:hypothetical protein